MHYSPNHHAELTPHHYENLIATGYLFLEFLGFLETQDEMGIMLALYKPLRLKTDGQNLVAIDDPMIKTLVYSNQSVAIFIENDY